MQGVYSCNFQGYCYTQLTDVQQEVNGLLDEQHNPKFDMDAIRSRTLIFSKRNKSVDERICAPPRMRGGAYFYKTLTFSYQFGNSALIQS